MGNNDLKLDDQVIHRYEFWDRETKKDIIKEQKGFVISFSFNYKEENPLKIYTIKFEDGKEYSFIDKSHPDAKRYFGWDIKELTLNN